LLQGLKDEAEIFWVILHEFYRISMQSFDASGQELGGPASVGKDARHSVHQARFKALIYNAFNRHLRIRFRRAAEAEGYRFSCPAVSSSPFTSDLQPQAFSFLAAAPTVMLNAPSDPAPLRTWSMLSHGIENEIFVRIDSTKCLASLPIMTS
jgi:hypothetical protein